MVKHIKKFAYIIVAVFGIAVSINMFLGPHSIAAGGITGIAIILDYMFEIDRSLTIFIANGLIIAAALIFLGREVFINTVVGALLLPVAIWLIPQITLVEDVMLSVITGSIIIAISASILYANHASTGGTTLPPLILKKYFGISTSIGLLISDGAIILITLRAFGTEPFLYAVLSIAITAIAMNYIESGIRRRKKVYIISEKSETITNEIQSKLERGVTLIPVVGAYERKKKDMIMVTMDSKNYRDLLDIVKENDEDAFMITESVSEVHGKGFTYNSGSV